MLFIKNDIHEKVVATDAYWKFLRRVKFSKEKMAIELLLQPEA